MLTFKIHHASTNNSLLSGFLAGKLAALRLQALTVSAQAFGGQLVTETFLRMPYTQWIERLQSPHVHTFIAVAYPAGAPEEDQTIDKGEIVGTAVLSKCPRESGESFQWRKRVTNLNLELGPFQRSIMR
jgi:hypothetical protein